MKKLVHIVKIVFLLVALFLARPMTAQVEMSVAGELTPRPDDADAVSYYRQLDANDNVCALIKVKPSNPMGATLVLQTGGGIAPVPPPKGVSNKQADGSWWYWLSPKTRNIFFTAEGYTETAPLGVRLEPGKVYELKLTVGAAAEVIHKYQLKRYAMKLDITPKSCVVSYGKDASYNMDRVVIDDGYFEAVLDQGIYYYKIENEYYETYTGTYRLDAASKEESISMKPAFGYLRVTSEPSGAEVYLDGSLQSAGKTPFTSGMLTRGTHSVLLRVDDYYSSESRYDVLPDGTVQDVPVVRLKPQFGTVTCLCEDAQAELTVSDASGKVMGRGKSGMMLRLNSRGSYKLESVRSGHASQSIGIQGGAAL
ncbi:MAG: PEGA domain-containing protein, partial [Bacteroidales bacterium]|nr:PEGA domain-containing protein [Bacteroidales bacterium]